MVIPPVTAMHFTVIQENFVPEEISDQIFVIEEMAETREGEFLWQD